MGGLLELVLKTDLKMMIQCVLSGACLGEEEAKPVEIRWVVARIYVIKMDAAAARPIWVFYWEWCIAHKVEHVCVV